MGERWAQAKPSLLSFHTPKVPSALSLVREGMLQAARHAAVSAAANSAWGHALLALTPLRSESISQVSCRGRRVLQPIHRGAASHGSSNAGGKGRRSCSYLLSWQCPSHVGVVVRDMAHAENQRNQRLCRCARPDQSTPVPWSQQVRGTSATQIFWEREQHLASAHRLLMFSLFAILQEAPSLHPPGLLAKKTEGPR